MSENIEVPSKYIDSPARKLFYVLSDRNWDIIKYITGRVLTIIDASIQDKEQRKALKDIIEQAIYGNENNSEIIKDILNQFFFKYAPKLKSEDEVKFWNKDYPSCSQNYFPEN